MTLGSDEEGSVSEDATEAAQQTSEQGLMGRLRDRGSQLARGRRVVVALPGWEDVGDGRALWGRFKPISRGMQMKYSWTPNSAGQEIEVIAPMLAEACEEILIGTREKRTPLADEPDVAEMRGTGVGPLRFDADLGRITGVGGDDGAAIVKRLFVHADDDLPIYALWAELLAWSTNVETDSVEVAAGE